ncbi:MAG: hypothetical protein GYA51_00890 [Candidatus Methanofastidiosa archaeon]|nr:hypothetical protein [Candidatus Methanofastidiosa archaeon]
MKSSLIKIEKGQKVLYDGEKVTINDYIMVPNGAYDPKIVCLVYAIRENGNTVSATSDKFQAAEDEEYEEFYPSVHMDKISDFKKDRVKNLILSNVFALIIAIAIVMIGMALIPNHEVFWGWMGACGYWTTYLLYLYTHNFFNVK